MGIHRHPDDLTLFANAMRILTRYLDRMERITVLCMEQLWYLTTCQLCPGSS